MDAVKAFNAELSALYDVKPPISKAKMNSLTRGAIKAIKFYKHVVQSVEKFIQKCKPEYKVPGLYVIDSIVRQSRHQFGVEKDVFAPRFAKNMQTTFLNLLKCPPEDKSKVIRVLNLWQKNSVFQPEVIQPLFDLADPNHPIHKEQSVNSNGILNASSGNNVNNLSSITKTPPSGVKNVTKDQKIFTAKPIDPAWLAQTKLETANMVNANKLLGQSGANQVDVSFLDQLQHLQQLLLKKQEAANETQSSVKFDKKLLDFDYGEEEDDDIIISNSPTAATTIVGQHNAVSSGSLESLGLLLTNPEVLRQLQTLQQTMQGNAATVQHEMEEKMRKLQQMKQQEEEFDKHLAQTVPNLPFASECELKASDIPKPNQNNVYGNVVGLMQQDMSQPPPGYPPAFVSQPSAAMRQQNIQNQTSPLLDERQDSQDYQLLQIRRDSSSVEIVNLDSVRSQSRSPERFRRHSRSRSPRHRGRDRDRDRERKSRSRSRSRRRRTRSRERKRDDSREKTTEEEREKLRERRKRGLPPIIREKMSVCSTTLWVGHLSKLVHQEELSDTFGEFGDIVSIDLISPRGCAFICMNRRQDAYRALTKLKNHKMQGKAITLAWAPGKGVKGKEWKDYWEVELGVSYIPWNKLNNVSERDLELLEEGGMIDEDTLPPRLIGKLKHSEMHNGQQGMQMQIGGTPIPTLTDGIVNILPPVTGNQQQPMVDTSQPPPIRASASTSLMPSTSAQLSMIPPGFPISGVPRMIGPMGLQMAHGLMPNVPIGVPPPNMQSLLGPPGMMQSMLTPPVNTPFGAGVGLLTQIPLPAPAAPSDKSNSTGMPHNVPPIGVPPPAGETNVPNLPMLRQPFGVGPPPPPIQMSIQGQHSDDMDVEMEDAMPQSLTNSQQEKPPTLSDQLLAAMGKGPRINERMDNDQRDLRDRDNRDRDRGDRRDRIRTERDGVDMPNDRGRGRDRGRDRRRDGRDRDRDDRRDRGERDIRSHDGPMPLVGSVTGIGHIQEPEMGLKKDKMSLADRLRQLADGTLPLAIDDRIDRNIRGDRNDRNIERTDRPLPFEDVSNIRRLGDGPPSLMDLPKFPIVPIVQGDRPDFGSRGPEYRGPQDLRDFPRGDRNDRPAFGMRGSSQRGPAVDDFPDPRILGGRFPDEYDRLGPNGPRPEDFDLRLGLEFDRAELRIRHPVDDYEADRYEFERRQREGFDPRISDTYDPRSAPDHPDFDPRRREYFGHMDSGFGPHMGSRGPRGPIGPDGFGSRSVIGSRGHGPPMFHPRGMGLRGMRPGLRPQYVPRGSSGGPLFDSREGDTAFYRGQFDDGRGGLPPSIHMRPYGGPSGGGPTMPDSLWRNQENGPPVVWMNMESNNGHDTDELIHDNHGNQRDNLKGHGNKHHDRDRDSRNSRNRKSRWGNVSPSPTEHVIDVANSEQDCEDDEKQMNKDHNIDHSLCNDDISQVNPNSDKIPPTQSTLTISSDSQQLIDDSANASTSETVDNGGDENHEPLTSSLDEVLPSEQLETENDKIETNELAECQEACQEETAVPLDEPTTIQDNAEITETDKSDNLQSVSEQTTTENNDETL